MPRLRRCFCDLIKNNPESFYYKPAGISMADLKTVEIFLEEFEAFRLRHVDDVDQRQAAKKMKMSTSSYQRYLYSANKKIADALVFGKAIKIIKHNQL